MSAGNLTDAEYIAVLEDRLAAAIGSRTHTQQWYAERLERLKDLLKEHSLWDKGAAIIANGSLIHEPPAYAQQLNVMRHRAEHAERNEIALRTALEAVRTRIDSEPLGIFGIELSVLVDKALHANPTWRGRR